MIAIHQPADLRQQEHSENVAELRRLNILVGDLREQVWDRDDLVMRLNERIAFLAARERLLEDEIRKATVRVVELESLNRQLERDNAELVAMSPMHSSEE